MSLKRTITFRGADAQKFYDLSGKGLTYEQVLDIMCGPDPSTVPYLCQYPDCDAVVHIRISEGTGYCELCHGIYCGYHDDFRIHGCQRNA